MVGRLRPLLVLALTPACALVTEFDHEASGGGLIGGSTSQGTGSATTSSGQGGGATTSSSGGGGDGGGTVCPLPGDGPAPTDQPWLVGLGPIDPALDWPGHTHVATAITADKLAFAVPLFQTTSDVQLGGVSVAPAGSNGFLFGWIDDGGADSAAWLLEAPGPQQDHMAMPGPDMCPLPGSHARVAVAPWIGREVLVAVSQDSGAGSALLVKVDLCTRAEEVLAHCDGGYFGDVTSDPDSLRVAFALQRAASASCSFSGVLAGCAQPGGASGARVTYVVEPDGNQLTCRTIAEGANTMQLTQNGELLLGGIYQQTIFSGPEQLQTGAGEGVFHELFARLAPTANTLQVVESIDLGGSGLFEVPSSVRTPLPLDDATGDVLMVSTPNAPGLADGRFAPPATAPNGYDLMVARLSADPARRWAHLYGGTGWESAGQLTRSAGGELVLSARTFGASALGVCGDPEGCAAWAEVSPDDGSLDRVLMLDAADGAAGEIPYAGRVVPGNEYLVVGAADGVVTTDGGSLPAPPTCHRTIYFSRVAQP